MIRVDDLFDAFGGPAEVARIIGKSTEHAASMRRRGSIPVDYWPSIIAAGRERQLSDVTYESLTLMHAKPIERAAEAAQ